MTVNNANLIFSSNWDIDQLVTTNTTSVSTGITTLYISTSSNPILFEVQFQPTGSTSWFMAGANSIDGTLANQFIFYSYFTSGEVLIHTTSAGRARYFIWSDKVNY